MAERKSTFKLAVYAVLLLILFFGLIKIISFSAGTALNLELAGFFLLLLLSLIGLIGYNKCWGERVLFFVFLFYLANLILVWYFIGPLYLTMLFLVIVGFLMSFPRKIERDYEVSSSEEPHSEVFDVPKEEKKTSTKYSPGKYVASKRSNIYHEPKCDWAKKIGKERRFFFDSKEDAWEKGYKAHGCVE